MFTGHYAPAFVAAAARPRHRVPLAIGFVAVQLVDFGFFGLMLAGIEKLRIVPGITAMNPLDLYHMPYTHSLAGSAAWAAAFALVLWLGRSAPRAALIGGALVLSHWLLDLIVHRPDLTLAGSPPAFGFGLWDQPLVAMPLETGILALAFAFYVAAARPSVLRAAILGVALIALQAFNWFAPPPTEAEPSIAIMALAAYTLLAAVAGWTDASRQAGVASSPTPA